jgi:hypothetical protein
VLPLERPTTSVLASVAAFPQDVASIVQVFWPDDQLVGAAWHAISRPRSQVRLSARAFDTRTPEQRAQQFGLRLGPDDFDDHRFVHAATLARLRGALQCAAELLPQPGGFDGFRVSQKVADANDLPRSNVKDFSKLLTELDGGRPGGQVHVTEREDRVAEVAELPGPIGEAFPRLAAVLPPNLSRAVMTSVGSCLSLKARLDRRVPLDVGIELGQKGVQIIGIPGLDGALDGLHVLLRNSGSPRVHGRGFERNALPDAPG